MKQKYLFMFVMIIFLSGVMMVFAENTYVKEYTVMKSEKYSDAHFVVQTLKYEPYPVNSGDTFDLWVKVQNIGENDAKNAQFTLQADYPFSCENNTRYYGIVPGTVEAFKLKQSGDTGIEANQVVMKFKVKVADNYNNPDGIIKLYVSADDYSGSIGYDLPISIAKTKTDFDVKVHDITPYETSFIITNIGENNAKAVSVDARTQEGTVFLSGIEPSSLGDINTGEFTISRLKMVPQKNAQNITLDISYIDTSGVRSIIEKTITLDQNALQNACVQNSDKNYMYYAYLAIGLVTGIFIVVLILLVVQKRKETKQRHK